MTGVNECFTIVAIALSVAAITAVLVSPYLLARTIKNGFILVCFSY